MGWGQFAGGGLEIHDVPSGHISMLFEPHVQDFAESLRVILPSSGKSGVALQSSLTADVLAK